VIVYGYESHAIVLGSKVEQCTACRVTGPHLLIRKVWWASLFTIPFMPLRFKHGMICQACGAWTGIPWRAMRAGLKARRLPLPDRKRTEVWEAREAAAEEWGHTPTEAELFDTVVLNPKRGGADLALKAWPVAVVVLVAALLGFGAIGAIGSKPVPTLRAPTAHTCYLKDGFVNGCQYDNGTVEGYAIGTPTTCLFSEPLPTPDWRVYCP
jgi:hypothetical protein